MTTIDAPNRAGRRQWLGLAVLCLPSLLATVDINVVFLALPALSGQLGAGATEQLWITDVYGFMLAGFLVTMGRLGDRFGRRTVLLLGASGFLVASVLAAYSTSTAMLITARALLGICAATVLPSVLALIRDMFPDPRQMATAMGVWGTALMGGVVLGPAVGGLLLGAFWWGAVFLIAVPVMGLLLMTGPSLLPDSRTDDRARIDAVSVALSLGAIIPAVYGLKEVARNGWAIWPVVSIVVGVVAGLAFVARQRVLSNPLLDLSLVRDRTMSTAFALGSLLAFVLAGTGLTVTMYLQMVQGLSPTQVGLWLLVPSTAMIVAGNVGPAIARRVRPAYVIAAGLVLAATGAAVLTTVDATTGLAVLLAALVIVYAGGSPVGMLTSFIVMASAPPEKAGSAGAISTTGGELGIALGVAVLGSLGAARYGDQVTIPAGVPAAAADASRESVAGAVATAATLPGPIAGELLTSAQTAFTGALHMVATVVAIGLLALAALAVSRLRHVPATAGAHAVDESAHGESPAPGTERALPAPVPGNA